MTVLGSIVNKQANYLNREKDLTSRARRDQVTAIGTYNTPTAAKSRDNDDDAYVLKMPPMATMAIVEITARMAPMMMRQCL